MPVYAPADSLFSTILPSGEFDAVLFGWGRGADPGQSVDIFRCGGRQNFTGYCNRQVSRDLRLSRRVLEPNRRAALLNRVDAQLARDVPVVPLYQSSLGVVLRPTLRGVVPADAPEFFTWNSQDWWLER